MAHELNFEVELGDDVARPHFSPIRALAPFCCSILSWGTEDNKVHVLRDSGLASKKAKRAPIFKSFFGNSEIFTIAFE